MGDYLSYLTVLKGRTWKEFVVQTLTEVHNRGLQWCWLDK